ncbi:MAG: hypothetical protein RSC00_04555 [Ruthenibacterium sp.]
MSSEFSSIAKSRARYYCKGAPVQFVQVELLRINENDNMVVTLTFKNLVPQQLTALTAHFRCKDAGGTVILEDDFTYTELAIGEGGLFGGDDAVYVSEVPLSSVEVSLVSADYADGHSYSLQRCPPVPLPALRALNPQTVVDVNDLLQIDSARYLPANVVDGWQCTCGAFNYNVGQGKVMCAECGADKAALFSAVRRSRICPSPMQFPLARALGTPRSTSARQSTRRQTADAPQPMTAPEPPSSLHSGARALP